MDNFTGISLLSLAAVLLLLERFPWRGRMAAHIQHRWVTNLGLMLLGGIVVSIFFPVGVTEVVAQFEGGLMRDLGLPLAVETALVLLLMDCWSYWEHRVFHEVPLLWRIHLVHHSDTAVDVTTGQRHHPLEKILSTFIGFLLVFAMGFSTQALGFYLLVALLSALYTHANIRLPEAIDRPLRRGLVTPAVHAIHHSKYQPETDSNYGSILTIWDRLFGTYTDPSAARPSQFGLEYYRQPQDTQLISVLVQPFLYRRSGLYPEHLNETAVVTGSHGPTLSPQWRQALLCGAIGLALAVIALWPTIVDLALLWGQSGAYQYAWLVLPVFVYVAGWYHRDSILAMTPNPGYSGLLLVAVAIALWVTALVADINLGQHIALVLVLQGIALCALGWATYRKLLPLMLLLFLMVPCGDAMQPLLRNLTVKWIEWFALLTGLPHTIEGYYIYIGEHEYVVLDACSGLLFFTLGGFLGYSFGLLLFRSLTKVVALAALGAALGILTNALRVCLIITVDWLQGSQMDLAGHTDIQWVVWLASLGLLLYLASKLAHDNWPEQEDERTATALHRPAA